jgi:hypothetical protein
LGTLNLLQHLQVQPSIGELGMAKADSAPDQSHGELTGVEHPLYALPRGEPG